MVGDDQDGGAAVRVLDPDRQRIGGGEQGQRTAPGGRAEGGRTICCCSEPRRGQRSAAAVAWSRPCPPLRGSGRGVGGKDCGLVSDGRWGPARWDGRRGGKERVSTW